MGRRSNRDRVLLLLSETYGLSNLRVKTELGLEDDSYTKVRDQLLNEGLIEKYVCRGGGIRLTRKGDGAVPGVDSPPNSTVDKESELYDPLTAFLERQAVEDEIETVVCNTHSRRARGKWQNPDVTQISIEHYHHLRKTQVVVVTYEVKKFPRWDVSAVYEAASHHRFSHEAIVVLEWPNGVNFSPTDPTYRIDQIVRECQRFGVGLSTLHPYYNSYRLHPRIEPEPQSPEDEDVDAWLDYVFSRDSDARDKFHNRLSAIRTKTGGSDTDE